MSIINKQDFIDSIADALQFISYYHPTDFIDAMHQAWQKEKSPAAKDAITQILANSRLCAEGHRPICQDTGIVTVFLKIGMQVQWQTDISVDDMVNARVSKA
jgi:fumarate hydratase class I